MIITVVGLGYVGLPLALLAENKGYQVYGIDTDQKKVRLINAGVSPLQDSQLKERMSKTHIRAGTNFNAVKKSDIVIICVPTPVYKNHLPNLEPLKRATHRIAEKLKKRQLVILESTVNPGVSENIIIPMLEKISGLSSGKDFYFAHCPERINPGDKKWNIENIPRVIGGSNIKGRNKALNYYQSIISAPIRPMGSLKETEAVKVVENSFRDINIAFVNELAKSFAHIGIDTLRVINGAATKPFAFMKHLPGCGVGGHCIPVDPYYLIQYGKANGFEHEFLRIARKVNSSMPQFTVRLVNQGLKECGLHIKNAQVAVLGLAYKPDIDDHRESPSFEIIKHLKKYSANVVTYDPFIPLKSSVQNLDAALKNTHAVIIATAHNVFKEITPALLLKKGVKVLIDGRNCLDKDTFLKHGVVYKGIGR